MPQTKLTRAQRTLIEHRTWSYSLRGLSLREIRVVITREFGIELSERHLRRLLRREMERAQEQFAAERRDELTRYLAEQRAVMADAWKRLARTEGLAPSTVPQEHAVILEASTNIAKALGLLRERHEVVAKPEFDFGELMRRALAGSEPDDHTPPNG
jgi:hypothetical protein